MPEDLLAARWTGRAPWVETWYALVRPADAAWALWARYQILARRGRAPRTSVWGVFFSDAHVAARADDEARPRELHASPFAIQSTAGRLDAAGAVGRLPGLAWDLAWKADAPAWSVLPHPWMLAAPFPRMKVATPVPRAVADGTITLAGRRIQVAQATLMLGHTWGTAHARRWAWVHAAIGDVVFEAVTGVPFAGSPPLTSARLRVADSEFALSGIRTLLGAPSSFAPVRWKLRAEGPDARVVADAAADDAGVVALEYRDPSGGRRVCHGCERARIELSVESSAGARTLSGFASLEVGLAAPAPGFAAQPYDKFGA